MYPIKFFVWLRIIPYTSAFGKAVCIASINPDSPSTDAIRISRTPRFFNPLSTFSQYFELSVAPSQIPKNRKYPKIMPEHYPTGKTLSLLPGISRREQILESSCPATPVS